MKNFRSEKIDLARGVSILVMVFYHFCWDLGEFGILDSSQINSGGWRLFAQLIGSTFLFISGLSFWLYYRFGRSRQKFFYRVLKLIFASLFVSFGTAFAYGDYFVFFGILHLLAFCTLFATIICRLPVIWLLVLTVFIGFIANYISFESFSSRFFAWTGLYGGYVGTVDFYPFFPWASPYVLGLVFGKLLYGRNFEGSEETEIKFKNVNTQYYEHTNLGKALKRFLIFLSSYSLYVYLIHQPILFGGIIVFLKYF